MEKVDAAQKILNDAKVQRDLKDDYRKVFGSKEGCRVLTDLLQFTGVLRPVVTPGDPFDTAFNAGRQSVGFLLLDVIDKRGYEAIIELEKYGVKLTEIGDEL